MVSPRSGGFVVMEVRYVHFVNVKVLVRGIDYFPSCMILSLLPLFLLLIHVRHTTSPCSVKVVDENFFSGMCS